MVRNERFVMMLKLNTLLALLFFKISKESSSIKSYFNNH
ncbi:hypothetical protein ZPR_3255 [Zunongwangia profunda SM-A87]|uniref:Uncharacterized protein n=1 Tax=Zunongwangia profunda (strain DSM 18752 / CCTCC AB 206139 / SM-A87) TaxID=655815 RepID=D5BIF8_ZUNPS|nr:hypothetical protein ZPR_3255 [Zunongwangia profunda SM-A87]